MKLKVEITGEFLNPDVPDDDVKVTVEELVGIWLKDMPGLQSGYKVRVDVLARPTRCANCSSWVLEQNVLPLEDAPGLGERLTPGDEVPAGECPHCRAFCYFIKNT